MFNPWVGKIPWRRKWQPAPVFLPGKSYGQRSLVGYSSWGLRESDMTEHTHTHTQRTVTTETVAENCSGVRKEAQDYKAEGQGFPGGSVAKNPPAKAGGTGLIHGPWGSHMARSSEAHAPQPRSLFPGAWEPRLLNPACPEAHAPQQEKPLQWETQAPPLEKGPATETQHSEKQIK